MVDFKEVGFQFGQSEWEAADMNNNKNRWVFPLDPTVRGYAKMDEYSQQMGNLEIEVLAAKAGGGCDFAVKSTNRQNKTE